MATPRCQLVDPEVPMYYHITSRCVQRSWLLGRDPETGKNYNYRRAWIVNRLAQISQAYSVSVETYAIMSNHFHLVVFYDPTAARDWTDEEVARRWFVAHPAQIQGEPTNENTEQAIELLVEDRERVAYCRASLGSLSEFMKSLKQPIAQRANKEANKDGHFWAERFYSGAILSERSLLTTLAYVDLNPIRAKITEHIDQYVDAGIARRLAKAELNPDELESFLAPCFDGLVKRSGRTISISLAGYRDFLNGLAALDRVRFDRDSHSATHGNEPLTREERWQAAKQTLGRHPRVIGGANAVRDWLTKRGFSTRDPVLPESLA